jgi:hypothetical protein
MPNFTVPPDAGVTGRNRTERQDGQDAQDDDCVLRADGIVSRAGDVILGLLVEDVQ